MLEFPTQTKENNSKRRCSVCSGSGQVHCFDENGEIVIEDCPSCDGKGWVQNVHGGEW